MTLPSVTKFNRSASADSSLDLKTLTLTSTLGTILHIAAYLLKFSFRASSSATPGHFQFCSIPTRCAGTRNTGCYKPGLGSKLRQRGGQQLQRYPWTLLPKSPSETRPTGSFNSFYRVKYIFSHLEDKMDFFFFLLQACSTEAA